MPLPPEDKIALEHGVDLAKTAIPPLLRYYKDPQVSSNLLIRTAEDYALGQMTGYVMGAMTYHYLKTKSRKPTIKELDEFTAFLNTKIGELRKAMMIA